MNDLIEKLHYAKDAVKWLIDHADKMYRDPDAGHVGYLVSGHWYEVMKLSPMKEVKNV